MTVLFDNLISDTERHLLAGDREQMNRIAQFVDEVATTIAFDFDLEGIQEGAYVAVDLEVMYVWSTNDGSKTATVQRAMLGSPATVHSSGTVAFVNPKFSKYDIANAVNMEIRDLSGPPNGLFQVKEFTLTTQPVQRTYTVPAENLDLIDVLEVRYIEPGAEKAWLRKSRRDFWVLRNMPDSGDGSFSTGMGLRFDTPFYPGRTMSVRYAAPFTELVNLIDVVTDTTGIPDSAVDIPPLGAAARLMGVREAKRAFTENEVDTRRASEVPSGSASRAAGTILSLLHERIKTEYLRLRRQWPDLV